MSSQRQKLEIDTEELDDFLLSFHSRLDFYSKIGDPERIDPGEARALKNEARRKLVEIQERGFSDEQVARMYGSTLREGVNLAAMLESWGRSRESFLGASRRVWGEPDHGTFRAALDVLASDPSSGEVAQELKEVGGTFSASEMKDWMEIVAGYLGMDWKVNVYEGTGGMSVSSANRTLHMPSEREFSRLEMFRLPLHELGRHAESHINGVEQPYRVMGLGVGGYEETDEGTAVEIERTAGLMEAEVLKKYAARAAAVYMMNHGEDSSHVRERISNYEISDSTVEQVVDRVYTGGGYSRDHIYFEGFRKVQRYLGSGGELADLFIGKVPVEALQAGLADREEIEPPRQDPEDLFTSFRTQLQPAWEEFRNSK